MESSKLSLSERRLAFESIAKLTMPELFDVKEVSIVEFLDGECEKYTYHLDAPLPIEHVVDILQKQKDLLLLYHFVPSEAVMCGRSCCVVSDPAHNYMVRISAVTNDVGLCTTIHLTLYHSLDIMIGEVDNERKRMLKRYHFGFDDAFCRFLLLVYPLERMS